MKAIKLNDIKFLDLAASYAIAKGNVDILALVLENVKEREVNNVASGANHMSMVDKAILQINRGAAFVQMLPVGRAQHRASAG